MSSRARNLAVGLVALGSLLLAVAVVLAVRDVPGAAPASSVAPVGDVPTGERRSSTSAEPNGSGDGRSRTKPPARSERPARKDDQRARRPRVVIPTRDARLPAVARPVPDPAAVPTAIRIDAIGTDAPVAPAGVDPSGALDVPDDVDAVGWYRYGAVPGADGVTVIAGHVDSRSQGEGVLFRLGEVEPGSPIVVTRADGATVEYVAVARRQYEKTQLPAEVWERTGPSRLVVITCGGPFDAATRSYRDNVVVWAEPR